ncbi:putative ribonuclease H-like domain-containing protein [Tanacetum coccineum]|uniref:Ribonuclease H-like domain-containing protein n=1 Tax=Tanacetum coccineum TaxID=301880 RepID=A0ABQ4YZN3_9ASTR
MRLMLLRPRHVGFGDQRKKVLDHGNPQQDLKDKGVIDSGCSRHMTGNKSYLIDYEEINGGFVTFGGNSEGGKITGKGKIRTGKLDFEDVYFVKELQFNLFSISQICDKKNSVLFTDIECVVLSPDFKLTDESHVLLKVPRKDNMYSVDLKNVVPQGGLTCLFEKPTPNESNLWHRRLGHVNFKTLNKLVRGNLVRGLPSKLFEINQTCVACQKEKQHRASSKDETSEILKTFITGIENLIDLRVKVIRCDNGTEFKNKVMNQFCEMKGIKREFSVARTPQQNGVENISFYDNHLDRPVTILNTIDHLVKFDGKADEGFFVGYSTHSKAFRVFNSRTRIVEENMHVKFSKDTPNNAGSGPNWLFDIDALTKSMNYKPVVAGNQFNGSAGTKACANAGKARMETVPGKDYILLPFLTQDPQFSSNSKDSPDDGFKPLGEEEKKDVEDPGNKHYEVPSIEDPRKDQSVNQEKDANINSTNNINIVSLTVNVVGIKDNAFDENTVYECADDTNMPNLEEIDYSNDDEDVGAEADMTNLNTIMHVSPIPTTRLHKDRPLEQIIRDIHSAPQTRRMTKSVTEHEAMQEELLQFKLQQVWTLVDLPHGKRAIGTKWVYKNKKDERGIVIRNKSRLVAQWYTQEEGIDYDEVFAPVAKIEVIRLFLAYASYKDFMVYQMDVKSAFLYGNIEKEVYVCQPPGFEDPDFPDRVYKVEKALYGLHQAPRAWYETLSTYLLENRFQRGQIDKTLFIKRDQGDILIVQVYVDDIIFGSTKKKLCTEFEKMMHKKFQMSSMGELTFFLGLQVKQKEDGIFISQDKYVTEILKKFGFSDVKTASTPMETHKPLLKDADGEDIDEHMYRSMIGSLMYLTSSRPDIMFAVCACARFQVNPKISHLHVVKRIFRYLKGQPKLGFWYPKDLPFDLVAYTDSDYAGASLDRKSTTGGCQFLGCRLISWQCKKQTVVANSTTEAEYIAASNCCGQVLWIQNQLLDYGYNFMQTKIHIDNESTICIVKNPVFHSKTKHIEIRHHFIRDSNEKKLIQMIKIHTDQNVVDLLTKAFDRIIHKGWLEWNAKAAKDGIGVKISNSRVNVVGHYLFWSTAKIKTINNETQIHAKVEGKTIVISKSSVRRSLWRKLKKFHHLCQALQSNSSPVWKDSPSLLHHHSTTLALLLDLLAFTICDNDGEDVILDGEVSGALIIVGNKEKSILE